MIMEYLISVGLIVFLLFTIYKFKYKGFIYFSAFIIPFRFIMFSVLGVDFRINDIFFLLTIIIYFLKCLLNFNKIKVRSPGIIFMFYSWIIISLVLSIWEINLSYFIVSLFRLSLGILIGYIASRELNKEEVKIFISYWVLSSLIVTISTLAIFITNVDNIGIIFNIFSLNVKDFYDLKFSNSIFFEDPNNFSSYLLISIFIYLYYIKLDNKHKVIKFIGLFIIFLAIFITLSRSAYLALGITLFLLYLINSDMKKVINQITNVMMVLVFVIIMVVVADKLLTDISASSRLELWGVGVRMTLKNPIIGVGLSNSPSVFFNYVTGNLSIPNPHFHNLYLKISAELGLIGFILFSAILYKFIIKLFKDKKNKYNLIIYGLVAFLIQAFFVEYFESRHFWIILVFLYYILDQGGEVYETNFDINASI